MFRAVPCSLDMCHKSLEISYPAGQYKLTKSLVCEVVCSMSITEEPLAGFLMVPFTSDCGEYPNRESYLNIRYVIPDPANPAIIAGRRISGGSALALWMNPYVAAPAKGTKTYGAFHFILGAVGIFGVLILYLSSLFSPSLHQLPVQHQSAWHIRPLLAILHGKPDSSEQDSLSPHLPSCSEPI